MLGPYRATDINTWARHRLRHTRFTLFLRWFLIWIHLPSGVCSDADLGLLMSSGAYIYIWVWETRWSRRHHTAAQTLGVHGVVVEVFVRFHGRGTKCRRQGADALVSDTEVLALKSLGRLLPIAEIPACVVGVDGHQESCRLVRHQVQDRRQILIDGDRIECCLAL